MRLICRILCAPSNRHNGLRQQPAVRPAKLRCFVLEGHCSNPPLSGWRGTGGEVGRMKSVYHPALALSDAVRGMDTYVRHRHAAPDTAADSTLDAQNTGRSR